MSFFNFKDVTIDEYKKAMDDIANARSDIKKKVDNNAEIDTSIQQSVRKYATKPLADELAKALDDRKVGVAPPVSGSETSRAVIKNKLETGSNFDILDIVVQYNLSPRASDSEISLVGSSLIRGDAMTLGAADINISNVDDITLTLSDGTSQSFGMSREDWWLLLLNLKTLQNYELADQVPNAAINNYQDILAFAFAGNALPAEATKKIAELKKLNPPAAPKVVQPPPLPTKPKGFKKLIIKKTGTTTPPPPPPPDLYQVAAEALAQYLNTVPNPNLSSSLTTSKKSVFDIIEGMQKILDAANIGYTRTLIAPVQKGGPNFKYYKDKFYELVANFIEKPDPNNSALLPSWLEPTNPKGLGLDQVNVIKPGSTIIVEGGQKLQIPINAQLSRINKNMLRVNVNEEIFDLTLDPSIVPYVLQQKKAGNIIVARGKSDGGPNDRRGDRLGIRKSNSNSAYIIKGGKFSDLDVDMPKLYNKLHLVVKKGGSLIIDKAVDRDTLEILTKRLNPKKKYSDLAEKMLSKMIKHSNYDVHPHSKKLKIAQKQLSKKRLGKGASSNDASLDRLVTLVASVSAGNFPNTELVNEISELASELLKSGQLTKADYKGIMDKYVLD
jgi:hypothetical protein